MAIDNLLVFDIETIPDVTSARKLEDMGDLSDADVARVMIQQRLGQTGGSSDFIRTHLHRVVAISVVFRNRSLPGGIKVRSLAELDDSEETLVRAFFQMIDKHQPQLVSWNGGGFDLPVLHYRALLHGVPARQYWDQGEFNRDRKYNHYLGRYHNLHLDLMDVLSGYQARSVAPLQDIAVMLDLPGKLGMTGAAVWEQYQAANLNGIRQYCEVDVLNTYLVFLRWELNRGRLDKREYLEETALLREYLQTHQADAPHFAEFLALWGSPLPLAGEGLGERERGHY